MSRPNIFFMVLAIAAGSFGVIGALVKPPQPAHAEIPAGDTQAVLHLKAEIARLDADRVTLTHKVQNAVRERDGALAVLEQTAKQLEGVRKQLRQIATDLADARSREQTSATELASARSQMERMSAQVNDLMAKSEEVQASKPAATTSVARLPTAQQFPAMLFRYNRFASKLNRVLVSLRACENGGTADREEAKAAIRILNYEVQQARDLNSGEVRMVQDFLAEIQRSLAAY